MERFRSHVTTHRLKESWRRGANAWSPCWPCVLTSEQVAGQTAVLHLHPSTERMRRSNRMGSQRPLRAGDTQMMARSSMEGPSVGRLCPRNTVRRGCSPQSATTEPGLANRQPQRTMSHRTRRRSKILKVSVPRSDIHSPNKLRGKHHTGSTILDVVEE